MKSSVKLGFAFIAGALAVNIPTVFSNTEQGDAFIVDALANALYKVDEFKAKKEQESLDKLPNILDCQNMQWMKNCTEINNQAKRNPTAPLRAQNAKGIEFNFVPGTPSAVIRLQLEQTPEAAAAALTYMDTTWGEYKKSASLYQMEMWKRGPMDNILGLDRAKAESEKPKDIAVDKLGLSVFVHSQCGACDIQLTTLATLQNRYPTLKIKIFQVDQDTVAFNRKVTSRGLKGRLLSSEEANRVLASGVEKWPTIWIDNNSNKNRNKLSGTRSIVQIEESLQAMTHLNIASQK